MPELCVNVPFSKREHAFELSKRQTRNLVSTSYRYMRQPLTFRCSAAAGFAEQNGRVLDSQTIRTVCWPYIFHEDTN